MAQWRSSRHRHDDDRVRFSRPLLIVLIVACAALLTFDRPGARSPALSSFRAGFNDLALPVLDLAAAPLRGINNIAPWWRRQFELAAENRDLRAEAAELRAWRDAATALGEQVRRQQEILNLDMPEPRSRVTAWAVSESSGPFVRARLVSAGADDGVEPGYPAVNIYGLVGRTVDVGARSSRILLLTDLNSRVSVMADRSNARAMLTGDNSDYPRLDYVGRDPDLAEGDRIVSSGDDNVLPRGLPVGEAFRDREGRWRVALFSDASPLDLVWISPFAPVLAPDPEPMSVLAGTRDEKAPAAQIDLSGHALIYGTVRRGAAAQDAPDGTGSPDDREEGGEAQILPAPVLAQADGGDSPDVSPPAPDAGIGDDEAPEPSAQQDDSEELPPARFTSGRASENGEEP